MMNGNMVNPAAVNIKMFAQIFHRHGRAFDMPPRITSAPLRIPLQDLVFEFRRSKPQHKVRRITLVSIGFHPRPMHQILAVLPREISVSRKFSRIKINIPVRKISKPLFLKLFNELNHILNMVGCTTNNIRTFNIQGFFVLKENIFILTSNIQNTFFFAFCSKQHFIITLIGIAGQMSDIGNIHNMG